MVLAALPARTACSLLARLPCIALYCTLALRILLRCCQALPSTNSQCHFTAPQLRALAADLTLPTHGAIVDRIYRHRRETVRANTHDRSRSQSPADAAGRTPTRANNTADLEQTIQLLVQNSMQGLEDRLRSSLRPLIQESTSAENISLPSHPPAEGSGLADAAVTVQPGPSTASQPAPCVQQPPLPDKVKQRIIKGEYIDFDTLLSESLYPVRHGANPSPPFTLRLSNDPAGDVVIAQEKPTSKRTIHDLPSWMEAWNAYIQVLVQHFPARAHALLAYQRIICEASIRFTPRCWLRYDQRFRATAAADKTIRWDSKHNDLWLECFAQPVTQLDSHPPVSTAPAEGKTRRPCTYCGSLYHYSENCPSNPFRTSRNALPSTRPAYTPTGMAKSHGNAQPQSSPLTYSNTQPLPHPCRDFNKGMCQRRTCRFRHACTKCSSSLHGERDYPNPRYQQQLVTPLRPLQLECELRNHPDRGFINQLLHDIRHGCCIGYEGPHYTYTAKHLPTAHTHADVITTAIGKECAAGRMAGPYSHPPLPNLRCSGLGVVPKKDGGWRVIYHLSAPHGSSINDYIDPDQFSLHYCRLLKSSIA